MVYDCGRCGNVGDGGGDRSLSVKECVYKSNSMDWS